MKKIILLVITLISLTFYSCGDDDSVSVEKTTDNSKYESFISGDLDGAPFLLGFDINSLETKFQPSSSHSGFSGDENGQCNIGYGSSLGSFIDESLPVIEIIFENRYKGSCDAIAETSAFSGLFPLGNDYPYKEGLSRDFGISINYSNSSKSDAVFYNTSNGDNSTSSFTITSSVEGQRIITGINSATVSREIEGTFSCKLYEENGAENFIEITNGKFKIEIFTFKNGPL